MVLDRHLLDLMHAIGVLEHPVGLSETVLHIAALGLDVVDDVAFAIVDLGGVILVMDDGRALDHGLELVEDCGQDLVGHIDQPHRFIGDLRRLGCHRGNPVTDVANLRVEAHLVVRMGVGPALAAARVLDPRRVLVVQNRMNTRKRQRCAVVDIDDVGVGVRASEHLAHQLTACVEVIGERGVALGQLDGVDLDLGLTHHCHLGDVTRRHEARHRCRSIGPWIGRVDLHGVPAIGHRRQDQRTERFRRLATHERSGAQHGFDGFGVGGLAIQDARQHVAHLVLGRVLVVLQ